jgi:1-aminocyclopropane-1-carboxylate deaminase/D-cysteine desulfhydrase-like pyridoxal-dependent ACC family enzyme
MREFYKITGLMTDPIYSGKMFFGLVDQLKNNKKLEKKKKK